MHLNRKGQGLQEYALLLALIVLAVIVALSTLGDTLNAGLFETLYTKLTEALSAMGGMYFI